MLSSKPLFRQEALEAQKPPSYGRIVLVQPPSFVVLTAVAVMFAAAISLLFAFGSYAPHSTVNGQLLPEAGLIRIYSPRPGVVLERHVRENQAVSSGEVLFVVSADPSMGAGDYQAADTVRDLPLSKAAELRRQLDLLDQQLKTQKSHVAFAAQAVGTYQGLLARKYASREQLQQKQEDLLDQQARLEALQREQVTLMHELGTQTITISATQAGIATALSADIGQAVDGRKPLLSIVPADSRLYARLLAPSRAVGFVHAGDHVLLRYQAYPYQKFGHFGGTVLSVSRTAVPPEDLATQGHDAEGGEPLYEIRVRLDAQSVQAYGKAEPLRSGMTLEADLLQSRRHLYEWVLDPLFSLSGRV